MSERLLLDTHILLWLNAGDSRLTSSVLARMRDATVLYCSAASGWEVATKQNIGKLEEQHVLSTILSGAGITELPVTLRHAELAGMLPLHHRDPFDRMLIAQAISEGLTLVTADAKLKQYSAPVWLI